MCFLRILSIFLAVGIAAGVFFPGKRPFPDLGDMPHWRKHSFSVVLCIWGPLGHLWSPFGSLWGGLGSLRGAIGLPLGCPWLPLGALELPLAPFGPPWAPPSNFKLNVHRLRCLSTKSSLLEHAAGAAGAAEVVSRTRLGAHLPHAPGARMTVVTQTPSN